MSLWMIRWWVLTQCQLLTSKYVSRWTNTPVIFHFPSRLQYQSFWSKLVLFVDLHISSTSLIWRHSACMTISFLRRDCGQSFIIYSMYGCWDTVLILLIACSYSWDTCCLLELPMWSCISVIFYRQMNYACLLNIKDCIPNNMHWFCEHMGFIINSSHLLRNSC